MGRKSEQVPETSHTGGGEGARGDSPRFLCLQLPMHQEPGGQHQVCIEPFSTSFSEKGFLTGTNSARLAGQQDPRLRLSLPPQRWHSGARPRAGLFQ